MPGSPGTRQFTANGNAVRTFCKVLPFAGKMVPWRLFGSKIRIVLEPQQYHMAPNPRKEEFEKYMETGKSGSRIGLYIDGDLLVRCDAAVPLTNARSRSEFICDAIEYYIAALTAKGSSKVITPALESVIGGKIAGTEDRISRMIFKLAVEVALMNHLNAGRYRYDDQYLDQLRDYCVQEVKALNGRVDLKEIQKAYEG